MSVVKLVLFVGQEHETGICLVVLCLLGRDGDAFGLNVLDYPVPQGFSTHDVEISFKRSTRIVVVILRVVSSDHPLFCSSPTWLSCTLIQDLPSE